LHSSRRKQTIVGFGKINQGDNSGSIVQMLSLNLYIVFLLRSKPLDTIIHSSSNSVSRVTLATPSSILQTATWHYELSDHIQSSPRALLSPASACSLPHPPLWLSSNFRGCNSKPPETGPALDVCRSQNPDDSRIEWSKHTPNPNLTTHVYLGYP
jgi:hypothetical protein